MPPSTTSPRLQFFRLLALGLYGPPRLRLALALGLAGAVSFALLSLQLITQRAGLPPPPWSGWFAELSTASLVIILLGSAVAMAISTVTMSVMTAALIDVKRRQSAPRERCDD